MTLTTAKENVIDVLTNIVNTRGDFDGVNTLWYFNGKESIFIDDKECIAIETDMDNNLLARLVSTDPTTGLEEFDWVAVNELDDTTIDDIYNKTINDIFNMVNLWMAYN